jgi:hypothetical protein
MSNTTEIEAAIKVLTARITARTTQDEALKFTQAALNLAHVVAILRPPMSSHPANY